MADETTEPEDKEEGFDTLDDNAAGTEVEPETVDEDAVKSEYDFDEDEADSQPPEGEDDQEADVTDSTPKGDDDAAKDGADEGDSGTDEWTDDELDRLTDRFLDAAAKAGTPVTEAMADLRAMESPEELARGTRLLESLAPKGGDDDTSDASGTETPAQAQATENALKSVQDYLTSNGLDVEDFDPGLLDAINAQTRAAMEQQMALVAPMMEQVQALYEDAQNREFQAFTERFDGMVFDLGKTWQEKFGSGRSDGLGGDSPELKARNDVKDMMIDIANGRHQSGRDPLSEDRLFKAALNSVFGDEQTNIAKQAVRAQARDRSGKFTSPPSHKQGQVKAPRQRVLDNLRANMRKTGWGEDGDDEGDAGDPREAFL